jgi:hypothetical protein
MTSPPSDKLAPRFSLRALLIGMAVIAALIPLAGFTLRNASNWIGALTFLVSSQLLAATICIAMHRQGATRAFWSGCAIFGLAYFIVAGDPWSQPYNYELFTSTLSKMAYAEFFSEEVVQPDPIPYPQPPPPAVDSTILPQMAITVEDMEVPSERDFVMIAHLYWTLLFAFCGGWVSVFVWWTGQRGAAQGGRESSFNA